MPASATDRNARSSRQPQQNYRNPLGVAVSRGLSPREIVDCAQLAESLDYDSIWIAEGHAGDQFALLSACATATRRIRLGTSISSVYVRSAPTIAMAGATVDALSQGRFVLGLGSSHKVQVEPEHGLPYGKPIQRLHDTVKIIRIILAENQVKNFRGETVTISHFDLWFEPHRRNLPIYVAGLFPKMLRTCGAIADGVILTRVTLERCHEIRDHVAAGAADAGRDPNAIEIACLFPCAVADTQAEAFDELRPSIAHYAGAFPRYNRLVAENGFPDAAAAIRQAWLGGDTHAAVKAVPDALIDTTSICGTRRHCLERIEAYRKAGIDLPILNPRANGLSAFRKILQACGPQA